MTDLKVPPYLKPNEIAKAAGLSRKRVVTDLRHAHLLEQCGTRWIVSSSRLRERLPDYYDRVFKWFEFDRETM